MLNKKKTVITVIGILVLIAIVAGLSVILTNQKQATSVASETQKVAQMENTQENEESTWKVQTNITESQNQIETENITNNTTTNNVDEKENKTIENTTQSTENNKEQNITNTTQNTENNKEQNITNTTQNTENNKEKNNTNSTQTQKKEETTKNNTTSTENLDTAKKDSKDVKGVIWLTFDDGPSSTSTPKILDILKKYNVKATFFVLNYSDANEKYIKREVAEGHTIGIHGYSHEYSKIYKSKQAYLDNVYKLQEKIQKTTGIKTMYTRFPGGSSNTVSRKYKKGIMTELSKEMLSRGFKYYDWNISSGDAGGAKNSNDVYKNVTKNLSKKRGNLVLCHDFANNKKTIGALEDIIKYGKKNGYIFKAIDDNTPMYGQHINN